MFRLFKKYNSIDKTERKILNRTFFWLVYAFLLVRIIPLRWFSPLLGEYNKVLEFNLKDDQKEIIIKLSRNIRRLKKRIPWKVKCFEEAITAKKVLEKYNVKTTIYLGVARNKEEKLIAHAWLKSGDLFISGKKGYEKFALVGFYS